MAPKPKVKGGKKPGAIHYLFGPGPFNVPTPKAKAPTSHDVAEHEGRVPQVGVPSGPRQTVAPSPHAAPGTPSVYYGPPSPATAPVKTQPSGPSHVVARQRSLVKQFVTKAYSQKVANIRKSAPGYELNDRIGKAKSEVSDLRERLLNHPAVTQANSAGKVVSPTGLSKIHTAEVQRHAIEGPKGVAHSKLFGLEPRSLQVGSKGLKELQGSTGTEGSVGRTQAKAKAKAQTASEPSTLEDLGYASIGIPGIGVGGDVAKLAEAAGTAIPKLLAEGGAKQAAKEVAKGIGESAATKGRAVARIPGAVADAGRAAPKAIRGLPDVLRAGAKETPAALRAGAKAAPKYVGQKGLQSGERGVQAFSGVGALGALHKGGVNVPGGTVLEGQGRALQKDPLKVLGATANLAPSLLVSAFQLPVAAGASAVTGSPKPLEGALNEQKNFFEHFANTYGSSDAKKIEKATLQEGLLPEVLAGPLAAKGIEKLSGPLRGKARDVVESHRAPATDEQGNVLTHEHGGAVKRGTQRSPSERKQPITRQGERNIHRREEAFHASTMNDTIQLETARRRAPIDKYARKAHGERTPVREGVGNKGKDTLKQRPPDYLPFLARAGIDLHNPDAAAREIAHYAGKFKGLDHPAKYGVNPEALTARDAVKFFSDNPAALKDKNLAKALDAYREMANGKTGFHSLSTSDRNRYLAHAVMHDIPLPEDRVPVGAREHTDATTRAGAWEDLNGRTKQVKTLRKEGRKKYDQAQALTPKSEKAVALRKEAKGIYEKARTVDKGRRELHDQLKNFTRPEAKPNPSAKRTPYDQALEDEFSAETRTHLESRGLHPEPAYVPDQSAINRAAPDQSATGGQKPLPGGPKINEGYVWRHGLSRQGYEHLMNEGVLRQVARSHQFENWRRFREQRGIKFEDAYQHYGKDWAGAFDHGVMNRKDVVLVPTQVVNRLEKETKGGDPTEYEKALGEAQAARKIDPKDAQSGTIYEAYPKAAYQEIVAQAQASTVPKLLRKANRFTSMNMLSTPAFVGAQVVAETAQAVAEVNPARMIQGLHAYNKLTPEQKLRISGASGETAKAIFSPEDLQTTLGSYDQKPFADALGFFRRNVFGRSAKSFATLHAAGELDRLKGSVLRRGVLTAQVMRDLNGTWAKGRKLLNLQTAIQKEIGHLKPHEQLAWIAEHPQFLDRYQKNLHEAMGGWGNVTKSGVAPESWRSAALVFYPFLRMSIQWPLKYAINHPIKATALAYLAAQNNFALREALHGEPSFLNYAQIPVYGVGKNGKLSTINLSRVAPGGNALVTAAQGSGSILGALQPVLAAGVEGFTGQGPLGAVSGGFPAHVKAAGASILGLSPYVRAADTLKGQKASGQSAYGILGKRANIATEPLAALESKLKGSKPGQLEKSLFNPFQLQDINQQRDYAKLGTILGNLSKYGSSAQSNVEAHSYGEERSVRKTVVGMQEKYGKTHEELEALYKKHGLGPVAKRAEKIYYYTHPYPGSEETSGIYGKKSTTTSIYTAPSTSSSIYGSGAGAPPAFPHASDSSGLGLNIPGLGKALGAIANPLASLIGGEKAQAAGLPKAQTTLTGPLTPGQKTFAKTVAKETGLNPRVIGAQVLAEESGGAAKSREAEGNHNWLNIGMTDSGPLGLTQNAAWSSPQSAGKATAEFLKGRKYGASPGIQAILGARGKPPEQQIAAIAKSGWASSPTYQQSIEGTFQMIGVKKGGKVPKRVATRFQAGVTAATELNKVNNKGKLPYVWGGGHVAGTVTAGGGLDCSGAVSYVLQHMGVKLPGGVVSGDMGKYLKPGPGAVTVFYNPEHTFMKIGNKYFGTSQSNPGGGAGFIPTSFEKGEAESGRYSVGHVAGLGKKVALQMGVKVGATNSATFPGMTITEGGTTATIDPGAATTQKKAGFSNKPIKLSASQRLKMIEQITSGNLTRYGIPGMGTPGRPSVSTIAELGKSLEAGRQELASL